MHSESKGWQVHAVSVVVLFKVSLVEQENLPSFIFHRLTIKPWTIISDLRRQYVFCEPNMTHLGSPNPFYVCYSLATFIVFSLRNAKTEEGDWNPHVGKALRKLAETAQIVSSCIKPDAFAEPALRRLHKDYLIATSSESCSHYLEIICIIKFCS